MMEKIQEFKAPEDYLTLTQKAVDSITNPRNNKIKPQTKYDLTDVKQGEDRKPQVRTRTIKDFIKHGSKKENS